MDKQKIVDANQMYVKYFNSGNIDGLARLHTEDAVVMPPNGDFTIGRDKISLVLKEELDMGACDLCFTDRDIVVSGNIAYHEGTYSLKIKDDKGNVIGSDNGKYLVIWEKQIDGEWLMKKDIWNTSLPLNN